MFERLTQERWIGDRKRWVAFDAICLDDGIVGKAINRLAAYEDSGLSPKEVQELAQAKADGRLVVLPCKTEDTVFIVYAKKILETTVDKRAWTDDDGYMLRTKEEWFKEKDIGKTVFLTKEEAEKALERSGQDGCGEKNKA